MSVYAINILGRITSDRKTHDTAMVRSYSNTYVICSAVWFKYKISTPAPSIFDLTRGTGAPSPLSRERADQSTVLVALQTRSRKRGSL